MGTALRGQGEGRGLYSFPSGRSVEDEAELGYFELRDLCRTVWQE